MLDKPIYVGFSILDLSKLLIYEFHYEYTGVKYDCGAKFSFTDTDSLVFEIETDDVYEDSFEYKGFRDYPKDSRFYDPLNKKRF